MDYKNGKIYTIRSNLTDKFYIGSTTSMLSKRLSNHKSNYCRYLKGSRPNYITSFDIIKLGEYYIELLEDFPCDNKNQLHKREGELIREHKANCVNKIIAGRSIKEYVEENKERIKEYREEYYENNKEKIIEKTREYKENNRDKIREYAREHHEKNKNKINARKREYYEKNKDNINARRRELSRLKKEAKDPK